jgi:hypothetical protein
LKYLHTKLRLALTIRLGVVHRDVEVEHKELVVDDGDGDVIVEFIVDEDGDEKLMCTDVKRD